MKKLRLTHHSALILGLRRLLVRTWCGKPERPHPTPDPIVDPVDVVPATSYAQWLFAAFLVVGAVAVKACMDGSKGETRTMNFQFLLAALVGTVALIAHVYNFEVLIWPKLRTDCFPTTPFASPAKVKTLYREHWHFLTVSWLLTIGVMLFVTFGDIIPYANLIVLLLIGYWISIVIAIFFVIAISLLPGESYIATLLKSLQWVIILVVVGLMFWGFSK